MGQFSMKICASTGSLLSDNQQKVPFALLVKAQSTACETDHNDQISLETPRKRQNARLLPIIWWSLLLPLQKKVVPDHSVRFLAFGSKLVADPSGVWLGSS